MQIEKQSFGKTASGEEALLYTITNKNGMSASFTDFGAIVVKIMVPDRWGKLEDVVLGYDELASYEHNEPGYGSFIGRNANRIKNAVVHINNKTYELEKNDGQNNLHGGSVSYNKYMYKTKVLSKENLASIEFFRVSPDMEQGFPGELKVSMTYTLTDENELILNYHAVSNQDTVVNFTNHSYFNLAGHGSGAVLSQKVKILANQFTPTDDELIPTGEIRDVAGTPMDFRTLKPIGQDIFKEYTPLKQAGGYDHNYILDTYKTNQRNTVEKAAELVDEKSGRVMEVYTDMPGIQLYTGNFITGTETGKEGIVYEKRGGVCFETQYYPNSCNTQEFPSCILKAGELYDHCTIFKFSVSK